MPMARESADDVWSSKTYYRYKNYVFAYRSFVKADMTKSTFLTATFLILAITAYSTDKDVDLAAVKPANCDHALRPAESTTLDVLGQQQQVCADMQRQPLRPVDLASI